MQICTKCEVEKSLDMFSFRSDIEKYRPDCKECRKKYMKAYYSKNKDQLLEKQKEYCLKNKEKIKEYQKKYQDENRDRINKLSLEWAKNNPKKRKKSIKKYYINNKDKILLKSKEYRNSNKEKESLRHKVYRINNKEKIKARRRDRIRKRRKEDKNFMLKQNVSKAIRYNLKKKCLSKRFTTLQILPYTIDELKIHLESQWEDWMNWDNYGNYQNKNWDDNDSSTWKWNIDHIIPQSRFNFRNLDELVDCWELKNLRPLSSKKNLFKGSK